MNPAIRALKSELEAAGLTVRLARSGHWRVETAGGVFVSTVPNSPSCPRAIANCRTHIKRRLREIQTTDARQTSATAPSSRGNRS